jgi:hypothetical protein
VAAQAGVGKVRRRRRIKRWGDKEDKEIRKYPIPNRHSRIAHN